MDGKKDLQSAEASAANAEINSSDAYTTEETGGHYTGTGRSDDSKGKTKGKGILKKGGPISIILVTLALTSTLMLGGQASQPFALVNKL